MPGSAAEPPAPPAGPTPEDGASGQAKSRVVAAVLYVVAALMVVALLAWYFASAVHVVAAGGYAPLGSVSDPAAEDFTSDYPSNGYYLEGETGGSVATFWNDGRFPVHISLPTTASAQGFRVHAGTSPTSKGTVLPGGTGSRLTPKQVEETFREFTLEPGALAWVSVSTWAPMECRGVDPGASAEKLTLVSSGPTIELVGTVLGRSTTFSVVVRPLEVPVGPIQWPPTSPPCGSFAP